MARKYSRLPWGNNYQRLPTAIQAKIAEMGNANFVVACSKIVTEDDLAEGRYRHLNIESASDITAIGSALLPASTIGRTSYYNANVEEKRKYNGGKVLKPMRGLAPHGRGEFHRTTYLRPVWPKQLLPPALSIVGIKRIGGTTNPLTIVARFQIQDVLNTAMPKYKQQVLRCVNLLQENTGIAGLFSIDANETEHIRQASEDIGWEIIPTAKTSQVLDTVMRKIRNRAPDEKREAQDRLKTILELKPQHQIQGSKGFVGYFAAQFTDKLTVFENLEMDNAMYVVRGEWREVSKLTRSDLRMRYASNIERIIHSKGWQQRLTRLVGEARGELAE
jgi:hypothetical protein